MPVMPDLYFIGAITLGVFLWFFCAYVCYLQAGRRRRRPLTWGILGIVFGPIALFALMLMPRGNLGAEAEGGHVSGPKGQTKTQAELYEVPKDRR